MNVNTFIKGLLVTCVTSFALFSHAASSHASNTSDYRKTVKIVVYFVGWNNNYMSIPSDGQIRSYATNILKSYAKFGNLDFFLSKLNGLECKGMNSADNGDVGSPAMLVDIYSKVGVTDTLVISKSAVLIKHVGGGKKICKFDMDFINSMLIHPPTT